MKNQDFQMIYKNGKSYVNKYLVMYVLKNNISENRLGISVSKKVGNSVVRHHITRLIRESFRLNKNFIKDGNDIIIVARTNAKDKSFKENESAFIHLAKLHNIIDDSLEM